MRKEVEYLEWDSDFFGHRIGRTYIDDYSNFTSLNRDDFDLVYVFSSKPIAELDWALKDEKCVLSCQLEQEEQTNLLISKDVIVESFDSDKHSYDQLLALVYESGVQSRFKKDTNFTSTGFKELYKKWLDNSLSGHFALDTLIAKYKGEVAGFLTFNDSADGTVNITLTAVHSDFRGKKIATILIREFKKRVQMKGYKRAMVVTQFTNEPAMHLYQKNLFNIYSITYIYHIWKHDTI
ncbi:GNAT family N-acetyltransferase [Myroides sp. WP-1]|uniref:GNAT family N-acetyltransferase n=1 Tax=Myroides sp. WP-1 TaxID=2759944 RepID=UPI0015FC4D5D|nr:GNAT family N-acetyltransferase [Myroides sp. WP-1]MBB1140535.1 GNAT family N-acetyltransferase [Myroides sp. WP-1]